MSYYEPYFYIFIITFAVLAIVIVSIVLYNGLHQHHKKQGGITGIGGSLLVTSQNVSIFPEDLQSILDVMETLTTECPPDDFSYNLLLRVPNTLAGSTSGWVAFLLAMYPKCDFYGLTDAQARSGQVIEMASICHAQFTVLLEVVEIYYNNQLPPDFFAQALNYYP